MGNQALKLQEGGRCRPTLCSDTELIFQSEDPGELGSADAEDKGDTEWPDKESSSPLVVQTLPVLPRALDGSSSEVSLLVADRPCQTHSPVCQQASPGCTVQPQLALPRPQSGQLIQPPKQQRQQRTQHRHFSAYPRKSGAQSPAPRGQLQREGGAGQLPLAAHALRRNGSRGSFSPVRRSRSVNVLQQPRVNSQSLTSPTLQRTETAISTIVGTPPRPPGGAAVHLSKSEVSLPVEESEANTSEDCHHSVRRRLFVGGSAELVPRPGPMLVAVSEMEPVELLQSPRVAGNSDTVLGDSADGDQSIHVGADGAQPCPSERDPLVNPTSTGGSSRRDGPQRMSSCPMITSASGTSVALTPAVTC
eukprot:CAMPEP_0172822454 /NCGR_PEP_ID=MMETSP1075-20121228/16682_1 /TAXON_ID=2916 /ORGANISM="Ceratium fusus, Strain PA161109" /LENGTH=362 /DNA_ID=CAMNT_0013663445 /DNA_START=12 /DNA_END=1097 /DNA_ORIENTATION=+